MPESILKTLADRIRFHRKNRGMTQVQLSLASGVEHRHLQKIEAGTVDLRLGTIAKIAKSLSVPTSYLLDDYTPGPLSSQWMLPSEVTSQAHLPIAVLGTDLTFKYVNNAFINMLGRDLQEFAEGVSLKDLLVDEEEQQRVQEILDFVLKNRPEPTPFVTTKRHRQGQPVRKKVAWDYVIGPRSQVLGFVMIYTDENEPGTFKSFLQIKEDIQLQ